MSTDPNPTQPLPGTGAPPHVPNPAPNPIPPPTPVPAVNQHLYEDDYPVTNKDIGDFQKSGGMPL
jgi:hypothetical protein